MMWEIAIGHIGGENLSLLLFGMDVWVSDFSEKQVYKS